MRKVNHAFFVVHANSWEQRKFGDELKLRRGLTYSPSNISQEGIRVLRSSNINEEYFAVTISLG